MIEKKTNDIKLNGDFKKRKKNIEKLILPALFNK